MRYDPDFTAARYDRLGAGEWDRWDRSAASRLQEAVYRHHLRAAARPGMRVLDAGCGAGRFTRWLVELGARVTALDLSPIQLELCRSRAPGAATYVQGSITDLGAFGDDAFDLTVALGGPLSYTLDRTTDALAELVRVTRPGGRFLASVMSLHGSLHTFLPGILGADPATSERVLASGDLTRAANDGHECHVYRVDELLELLTQAGLSEVEVSAPGLLAVGHRDLKLPPEDSPAFDFLLSADLAAGRENPGGSEHILALARR